MTISLVVNGIEFESGRITFPGGEINVNFLKDNEELRNISHPRHILIIARLRNSDDIMELLLLKNAVDCWISDHPRTSRCHIDLHIPYLPYARQDRVCNKGEAHSLKVMCNLINNLNFDLVIIEDCHSSVGTALLNNCIEMQQEDLLNNSNELKDKLNSKVDNYVIVSPDAGAEKKALKVAQEFGCDMIRATKRRDIATGKILEIGFIDPIPANRSFLIVDDICDGGGTFLPLAGELRLANANRVELYVTHGIFSKGTQILTDVFDTVYTTDSYYQGESTDKLKVIQL